MTKFLHPIKSKIPKWNLNRCLPVLDTQTLPEIAEPAEGTDESSSSSDLPLILGLAIGIPLALLLLAALAYFLFRCVSLASWLIVFPSGIGCPADVRYLSMVLVR
jgi:hypothetical protein